MKTFPPFFITSISLMLFLFIAIYFFVSSSVASARETYQVAIKIGNGSFSMHLGNHCTETIFICGWSEFLDIRKELISIYRD